MGTQLTMSSLSSSAYACYDYPHHHLLRVAPRIAAKSSVVAKRNLAVFSQGINNCKLEVVNADGMDCLPNPRTPWLKLCPELDTKEGVVMDAFYSIAEDRVVRLSRPDCLGVPATAKCFAATGEWLCFVNPIDEVQVYLANPFFSDKDMGVIRLPCLTTMPGIASVECDLETELVHARFADDINDPIDYDETDGLLEPRSLANLITNLAISHSDPRHVDCIVTALQGEPYKRRLAYSRIWDDAGHHGHYSLRWIGLQEDCFPLRNRDNQVVFSHAHKLFYTLNTNGIEAFDLFKFNDNGKKKKRKRLCVFSIRKIKKELRNELEQEENMEYLRKFTCSEEYHEDSGLGHAYHLVMLDDDDQLLLIVRHLVKGPSISKTLHFDVFKVVFDGRRLVRLKTLGDYCLFVGGDNSFSLRASEYPGLRPNSIYFICHANFQGFAKFDSDRGIFNLDTDEIEPITCTYCAASPLHQGPFPLRRQWRGCDAVFWVSPSNIIT